MNHETAQILNDLNARFYEQNATSFSQTRNAPWDGWVRCMAACGLASAGIPEELAVLDLACGNLRFESFLTENYSAIDWRFFAIDNCEPLVQSCSTATKQGFYQPKIPEVASFTCEDIISNMLESNVPFEPANTPDLARNTPFDLVVSFGFMHHIPGFDLRVEFLKHALNYVKPGDHLVVSFWQFLNDEAKRSKIEQTHTEALEYFSPEVVEANLLRKAEGVPDAFEPRPIITPESLEPGDYLLGWKGLPGQYRYCHNFTDEEIDRLLTEPSPHAQLVDSFTADGKTNNLNRYIVLKRI